MLEKGQQNTKLFRSARNVEHTFAENLMLQEREIVNLIQQLVDINIENGTKFRITYPDWANSESVTMEFPDPVVGYFQALQESKKFSYWEIGLDQTGEDRDIFISAMNANGDDLGYLVVGRQNGHLRIDANPLAGGSKIEAAYDKLYRHLNLLKGTDAIVANQELALAVVKFVAATRAIPDNRIES